MDRRDFLLRTGLALGGAALTPTAGCATTASSTTAPRPVSTDPWELLRGEFELSRDEIHLSQFLLAPHPRSVREAIEMYRRAFDENPVKAFKQFAPKAEAEVCRAAAAYLEVRPEEVALTDSTTMGLGLVYSGLRLREGDEIITSTHEHYATDQSLRLREERTGVVVRRLPLYDQPDAATTEDIVQRLLKAITPRTRALAVTWVLSSSGVKLPIRAIADALARVNADRAEEDHVLLCVDGVHGLGVEDASLPQLGCDVFISGCHKWLFGPRGTGFIWARPRAWRALESTIPTFHSPAVRIWARDTPAQELPPGPMMTPGGFHSFEHRWALGKAFELHQRLGRQRVAERIHALNRQAKEGLAKMPHVRLRTPLADELSAGIICFEVEGWKPADAVHRLEERRIIATVTPYATKYVRISPSLFNSPQEVDTALGEIRALA